MQQTGRMMGIAGMCVLLLALAGCSRAQSDAPSAQGKLEDAIKARTDVTVLRDELAASALREITREGALSKAVQARRKIVARGESKQEEGNILLTKDRYIDSAEAYKQAAKFYRQALDWDKVEKKLSKAEQAVVTARMLADAAAKSDGSRMTETTNAAQMAAGQRLQINAEGYLEAGDVDQAIAEFEKARQAFEELLPSQGMATLEQAVAARTAMLAAREQIKDLLKFLSKGDAGLRELRRELGSRETETTSTAKKPKTGSMADLLSRAQKSESAAVDAFEERQYSPARALFAATEKLYREAAVLQDQREQVQASRKSVVDSLTLVDKAFKSEARPASFERGKQALADADKALADDDFDNAKKSITQSVEQFATARAEADKMNAMADAQHTWSAALATTDKELLNKHASNQFHAAQTKATDAQTKSSAGQTDAATAQFKQATADLEVAVASAKTKENTAKASPVIARIETAIAGKDKFQAEDILAELENLIPSDARMAALRDRVAAMPGPRKQLVFDLGGGVKMEFVLIRPGTFAMGLDQGDADEKPVHNVKITKPFYLGKYEVSQEQWQSVMGRNPSSFKEPKNPVESISWNDCQTFVRKLGEKMPRQTFRLPTEAEWEYACRAGTVTKFSWGDNEDGLTEYGWCQSNSGSTTHPVGEKKPNAWGLYDMHGNVWEWCRDWYGTYASGNVTDPRGPTKGSGRVIRGGGWNYVAEYCRSSGRNGIYPAYADDDVGFRLVLPAGQ
ncbi:MAG: SUMF1/EgtB/PvdO family nonheme iron enzyme [bacterium]|nr:SUMF1/EgtB/PvdO family nonheme iron enzyme [bacterium]